MFSPTKGAFQMRSNDFVRKNDLSLESTQTQLQWQKRMRINFNKEKSVKNSNEYFKMHFDFTRTKWGNL